MSGDFHRRAVFQASNMSGGTLVTAPARATSDEHRGTKGGTFVAVRKHLQSVGVVKKNDGSKSSHIGPDGKVLLALVGGRSEAERKSR